MPQSKPDAPSAGEAPAASGLVAQATTPVIPTPLIVVDIDTPSGELAAIQSFFAAMPDNSGLAFGVITHLAPNDINHLPQILGRSTQMPATAILNNETIHPNHGITLAPKSAAWMQECVFSVTPSSQVRLSTQPIIDFFGPPAIAQTACGIAKDTALPPAGTFIAT